MKSFFIKWIKQERFKIKAKSKINFRLVTNSPELMSRLRSCFLCFILRFWNHVLTWVSLNPSAAANSTLSGVDKYLLEKVKFDGLFFSIHWTEFFQIVNVFWWWRKLEENLSKNYLWFSKRFSNPVSCGSLNTVRAFLRRQWRKAFTFIPRPRAISAEHPPPGKKFAPLNKPAVELK